MKPDRAKIHLSFPHPVYGTFTPIKLELEYPLGDGDNEHDAFDAGKVSMETWFNMVYPPIDGISVKEHPVIHEPEIKKEKTPESGRIGVLIADICSCTEVKVLESYRLMVKKDPALQAAYDQMLKKLSNESDPH